ncbi:MAG: hypothetical protein IJR14_02745 [Synergistaceae bacterium]|nr:hypothetical protein [Synergistaceae bacterium]
MEHRIYVSDLALCQRCPRLLAYERHEGAKHARRIGIEGSGEAYGSLFHGRISKAFFKAAVGPDSPTRRGSSSQSR